MPAASLHLRYVLGLLDLLPPGRGLTRREGTNVYQLAEGLALELARVHERTDDALREMIPWQAVELLSDWEDLLGVTAPAALLEERQAEVLARLQGDGPPTIPGFETIAASLGYTLTWLRDDPFVCGPGRVGMRIGGERRIFTWQAAYQVGGTNDALLERLLVTYCGGHAGGKLTPTPMDTEATFRGGQFIAVGPDIVEWTNAGDVTPLPSGFEGTASPGAIDGDTALDFDGLTDSMATTDDWREYVSEGAKYVIAVIEVDAAGLPDAVFLGALCWGLFVLDDGAGPALIGYSDDGGAGVTTAQLPIVLGRTYVVELLHADGWLVVRAFDDVEGHRMVSLPAPPTVVDPGELFLGFFDGRVVHMTTYGARGAVPLRAARDALSVALANQYTNP